MGMMSYFAFCPGLKKASPVNKRVRDVNGEANTEQNAPILPRVPVVKQYSYKELELATNNFNERNIIGEGGFGSVSQGRLDDATLIAIKVLSAKSEQGMPQFLKEIEVLSELHHVNLVKLHGCCTEGRHRMLVYGYVENNSLAQMFLVAIRPPNICLLVGFLRKQIYIVTVRKTTEQQYLPIRAWELYKKGRLDELVDEALKGNWKDSCIDDACRYLKIALLCTQERPAKRPTMSVVVRMLNGEIDVDNIKIPKPRKLMSSEPRQPLLYSYLCRS